VVVHVTEGRATRLRVWLDDGVTDSTTTAAEGISDLTVVLYPTKVGSWRLSASADDACGRHDQTGLSRVVTVQ
jgi:hypothetical protein